MNRLRTRLKQSRMQDEKLLSVFLTAGFPSADSLPDLIAVVEEAGADFVEVGVPFSDPIADGRTIQLASERALQNGMTLSKALEQIARARVQSEIPLLLMGYFNPFLSHGLPELLCEAREAGVDGFIIPDLIPEEFQRFREAFSDQNLGVNFLVSPNTPKVRIRQVADLTSDFIYCTSVTGVTGVREGVAAPVIGFLQQMRQLVDRPYLVGFGIATPGDARELARHCDGVIVGSALIRILQREERQTERLKQVQKLVSELKGALKGVEHGH